MQLSIFQLLKTGTSFKCKEPQVVTRKSSVDSTLQSFEKFNFQKFNPDDSLPEDQAPLENPTKSRRRESIDRIEKEMNRFHNQRREHMSKLMKLNGIHCEGDNVPQPESNFTKMMSTLSRGLVANIKKAGFSKPSPVQMQAIPIVLSRRNLIAVAPTGSGKTAAFSIPILHCLGDRLDSGPRCLIFAPTQELCSQLCNEIKRFRVPGPESLRVRMVQRVMRKGVSADELKQQWQKTDIMVCSPLKFLKMFKRVQLDLSVVEFLVMDESDKYFEMGMLNQVKQILKLAQTNPKITYLLFSATIQDPVENLFIEIMIDPIKLQVGGKNHVLKTINQSLAYCSNEFGKLYEFKDMINQGNFTPPAIIFVQSKERAESLCSQLKALPLQTQFRVDCIHGDKNTQEREELIKRFHSGDLWALICTDLMSRGMDFVGVNLVINYDFPNSMITYIHRVGRTGRAGQQGKAITFYTDEDKPLLRSLANVLKISGCNVPEWIFRMRQPNKYTKKHAKVFPVKRESIDNAKAYTRQGQDVQKKVKTNAYNQ